MRLVTFVWSLNAAIALLFALVCALAWLVDRRDLAKLMFCVTALATAAAIPFELAMMQAATAAEFAEQLRWYHLPIFFTLAGQLLFVRYYLGTGKLWLLWTAVSLRMLVLIANFLLEPNFNFREISSLQHIDFLGERIALIGASTPRSNWQILAIASTVLISAFVIDATLQSWRQGGSESRRKALVTCLAIIVPLIGNLTLNQLVASGIIHAPICATLLFLGTLAVIGYELGRELVKNSRARLQLADVRREWAQVERVNALGQLASALAHELSQPVAATLMNAEAARQQLRSANPDLAEVRAMLDDIHTDNARAAAIIDRMRAFIKNRSTAAQAFGLDAVAHDVLALLQHEAAIRRVDLKCSVPPGLPPAFGDRVSVAQVLLNLLINGMDAVQDRPATDRQVTLEVGAASPDNLEITVRDSGPGIPDGRFEEIFDPLFTTKASGLGVGLALSRMIIDAHGGRLWAENCAAGGAIFRFTLPRGPQARPSS
jgi:signal transduction histidine kinase